MGGKVVFVSMGSPVNRGFLASTKVPGSQRLRDNLQNLAGSCLDEGLKLFEMDY